MKKNFNLKPSQEYNIYNKEYICIDINYNNILLKNKAF